MKNVYIAACFATLLFLDRTMYFDPLQNGFGGKGSKELKAKLIRGPYLQVVNNHSIIIRWRTSIATPSLVRYGKTSNQLNQSSSNNTPVIDHIVKLEGLDAKTKYYYSIGSPETVLQGDKNNFFITLPPVGENGVYRIGVFGDPGSLTTMQPQARDQFLKYLGDKDLLAWIILGDNAYNYGTDAEYQAEFFNIYKNMLKKYPLFPVTGNHDYRDNDDSAYLPHSKLDYFRIFSMPVNGECGGIPSHNQAFYSYDVGNIHLIALDSFGQQDSTNLSDTTGMQFQWLKSDLFANRNKDWVIAYWHHPPYSMGSHSSDNDMESRIRERIVPLLERYGVDLVLCGHTHNYERTRLMRGHYGLEASFDAAKYDLSNSSGLYNGKRNSCPYFKDSTNRGTVYVVTGASSEAVSSVQPTWPHNAMYYADSIHGGANMIEVNGNRLDLKWICEDGVIRDQFTIMKNVNKNSVIRIKKGQSITLTASFVGTYEWNTKEKTRTINITPKTGVSEYSVRDKYLCLRDTFKIITE
ncbi:MAG TPA: metallophosphoesterase family protein [Chitinophagaceae bacterium]|nr:metallophosphoesterase family protein [Chitinophagaceae bacterium]